MYQGIKLETNKFAAVEVENNNCVIYYKDDSYFDGGEPAKIGIFLIHKESTRQDKEVLMQDIIKAYQKNLAKASKAWNRR